MTRFPFPEKPMLRRLLAERDGVAVVEFALVAPFMLFLLVRPPLGAARGKNSKVS